MDNVLSEQAVRSGREPDADRAAIVDTIQGIAYWGVLALGVLIPPVSVILNMLQ